MEETIGTAAGKIWQHLRQNGPTSAAKLKTELKLNATLVERSIGWLAREGKLIESKKGNCAMFEAKE